MSPAGTGDGRASVTGEAASRKERCGAIPREATFVCRALLLATGYALLAPCWNCVMSLTRTPT